MTRRPGQRKPRSASSEAAVPESPSPEGIERARELHAAHLARDLVIAALVREHALTREVAGQCLDLAIAAMRSEAARLGVVPKDEKRQRLRELYAKVLGDSLEARDRRSALKAAELLARLDGLMDEGGKSDNRTLGDLAVLLKIARAPEGTE